MEHSKRPRNLKTIVGNRKQNKEGNLDNLISKVNTLSMAKWKTAGHMAMVKKEAERQAEIQRVMEEQLLESSKNGKIIRSLERTRHNAAARAKADLNRTGKMNRVLNEENIQHMSNCHVAESDYFKRQDQFNQEAVLDWITNIDSAKEEVKNMQAQIKMIKLKERETDKEVFKTQLKLKALNFELRKVHVISSEKVTRRIEVAKQAYGLQLAENRSLVDEINHLEMERAKVRRVYFDLENDLTALSKELAGYTEEARNTYEQRDLNKRSMAKLKDHLEKSSQSFESDMQLLQFKIDVLRRMERFMVTKNKFRPDQGKQRRRENSTQLSQTEKDSILYSDIMETIKEDLKETNLQVIIKTFLELEEENYTLFKNISETRDSCHLIQMEIDDIKGKFNTQKQSKQEKDQEYLTRKQELKEKKFTCMKLANKKEEYILEANRLVQTYIEGVLSMLQNLGYTAEDILQLSGVYKKVEERNIRVFLAEIESYVNKLYSLKSAADYISWDQTRRATLSQAPVEPLPPRLAIIQRVVVVPPHYEDTEDGEDSDLPNEAHFRPLSCDEMTLLVDAAIDDREDNNPQVPSSSTMDDATREALGKGPLSSTGKRGTSGVDVF